MEVADMTGKTVVITGASSGIGKETAVALARAGARVVITARDQSRGEQALVDIHKRSGNDSAQLVVFDLANMASVREGAKAILSKCDRIDVLINNAGVVLSDRRVTIDQYETQFATNHLGPFLLTELLLDRIKQSAPARIVNVASTAHKGARGGLDFDDLQSTKHYSAMLVYSRTKLANIYFTTELARRLQGTGVTVNCLHPGTVATGYGRDGDTSGVLAFGVKLIKPFVLSAEKGAQTSIYLASSPEVEGITGKYFVKCRPVSPSKTAGDSDAARRLWEMSEELVAKAV